MGRDLRFVVVAEKDTPTSVEISIEERDCFCERKDWVDDLGKIWTYGISRHNDEIHSGFYTPEQLQETIQSLAGRLKAEWVHDEKEHQNQLEIVEAIGAYSFLLHECFGEGGVYMTYD